MRLLRAQHGERRRSGTLRRFDARVLATTNRDLSPLVQKGAFRADLWARLRDCRLYVPALRERQEDIPELLSLFVARAAQKAGKRMPLISSGLRRQAQTYHWPANLIELENCAHRALMFAKNLTLEPDPCLVSPQRLSDVLREHILHVLERTSCPLPSSWWRGKWARAPADACGSAQRIQRPESPWLVDVPALLSRPSSRMRRRSALALMPRIWAAPVGPSTCQKDRGHHQRHRRYRLPDQYPRTQRCSRSGPCG